MIGVDQRMQDSLVRPHCDCGSGSGLFVKSIFGNLAKQGIVGNIYLEQADCQPSVPATVSFSSPDHCQTTNDALVLGDVGVYVPRPRRALYLQPLPDQVKWKYGCLCKDAGKHARCGVSRSKGQSLSPNVLVQKFIAHEEETHIRHNLTDGGAGTSEKPPGSFMSVDFEYGTEKAPVNPIGPLRGESGPE